MKCKLEFDRTDERWYTVTANGTHKLIEPRDIIHVHGLRNAPIPEWNWGEEFEVYEMFGDWYAVEPFEEFDSKRILVRGILLSDLEMFDISISRN